MTSLRDMPMRQGVALTAGFSIIAFFGAVIAEALGMLAHGSAGDFLRGVGLGVFAVSLPALIVSVVWYWWLTRERVNSDPANIDTSPSSVGGMPIRQGVALAAGFSLIAFFGAVAAALMGMLVAGNAAVLLRGLGLGVFAVSLPALIVFVAWYWWLTRGPVNADPANIDTPPASVGDALATIYFFGTLLTGELIFFGMWFYCIDHYGLLLGGSLGWLPALVAAVVLSWFWPFAILAAVGGAVFVVGFT